MAKTKMSDFKSSRAKKGGADNSSSTVEKSVASPMLNTSRERNLFGRGGQTERKTIQLPVSKRDITLKAISINPGDCDIHPNNRRHQGLLNTENPRVQSLYQAIVSEGQRDPVLARYKDVDGEKRVEIIDGSRRRFVADWIAQEQEGYQLKVWVSADIPDADADYLTRAENENRDDISAWETAQYLKRVASENPNWTQDVIAEKEGVSRQSVSNYLIVAEIPVALVALLRTPNLLNVKTGLQLVKFLKSLTKAEYKQRLKEVTQRAPYSDFKALLSALKEQPGSKEKEHKTPTANKKIKVMSGDKLRAEIGVNRRIKGRYKVDLYDVSEAELAAFQEAIKKILK
jgi:ParB/RepB/Spo0J family partition protein